MTPTLAVIFAVTFVLGYSLWRRQQARVTAIDPTSAEWQAAVARARATLPLLRELFPLHPEQTLVKLAVVTASGSREHVWAQLRELGPETLAATIVTPLRERPAGAGPGSVFSLADLEDWHVLLPDGRIRGSFTTLESTLKCNVRRDSGSSVGTHRA
jgi:hypothetical protein